MIPFANLMNLFNNLRKEHRKIKWKRYLRINEVRIKNIQKQNLKILDKNPSLIRIMKKNLNLQII